MRPLCFLWFCVGVLCCTVCDAEPRFPYQLTISIEGIEARSGPGKQFYATDLLPVGAKIEVHRKEGDWLGIRPPDGSYSLVQRTQLRMTDETGVAEITKDNAICRIGSNIDKIEDHASQVRLQKGERVVVLDAKEGRVGRTAHGWRRISPPAGEFRWVCVKDLQTDRTARSAEMTEDTEPDREIVRVRRDDQEVYATASEREAATEEKLESSIQNNDEPQADSDKWVSRRGPTIDTLDEIELQFSLMVAKEIRAWRLTQLRKRAEALTDKLQTEVDKSRARILVERIREFEQLENRFVEVVGDTVDADDDHSGTVAGDPSPTAAVSATGVRYDGMGWLVSVHSTKPIAPAYALLDAEGDVLQYVSPAPGLNLRRYTRKQVGIFGQRGYLPALKKSHLTAERVVDLERHRR
jgi:SH3-like domain-containing protein